MTDRNRALLALLGAQLAVGAAAIFARFALLGTGPITASALRLAIAAFAMIGIAIVRDRTARFPLRDEIVLACAGVALAAHFAGWIGSLELISVAVSTLIVTASPIVTATYDAITGRAPITRPLLAGAILAFAGLALVVTSRSGTEPLPGHEWQGALLAFGGAVAIAIYLILARGPIARYTTTAVVARTYGWAALVLLFAMPLAREPFPAADLPAWGGILAMALVSQGLGHTGLNAALRVYSPAVVGIATLLEPVIAAILAWLIFRETVTPAAIAGGVLVLAGVGIVLRFDRDATKPED